MTIIISIPYITKLLPVDKQIPTPYRYHTCIHIRMKRKYNILITHEATAYISLQLHINIYIWDIQ